MTRYEFGPNLQGPSRSEVGGGYDKTVGRRLAARSRWRPGAGCRPVGSVAFLVNGHVSERGLRGLKPKSDRRTSAGGSA